MADWDSLIQSYMRIRPTKSINNFFVYFLWLVCA